VTGHLSEVDAAFAAVAARLAPVTAAVDSVMALATNSANRPSETSCVRRWSGLSASTSPIR